MFLSSTRPRSLRKFIFALLLATESWTLLENLLFSSGLIQSVPHLMGIAYLFNFTRGPLLFLFTLSIVTSDFKLTRKHLWHFVPFLIMLVPGFRMFAMSTSEKLELINSATANVASYKSVNFILGMLIYLQIGIYSLISYKALKKHLLNFKKDLVARWFLTVIVFFNAFLAIGMVYSLLRPLELIHIPFFGSVVMIIMTFLIQSLAYSFLKKQDNFIDIKPRITKNLDTDAIVYRFNQLIEHQKPFLKDTLTLQEVALELKVSARSLSQIVNQRFGKTFKDIMNEYRVVEAKAIMRSETSGNLQMLDVGLESGFNNKVSFYRVFKKSTGKSPSEYYEQLKAKQAAI